MLAIVVTLDARDLLKTNGLCFAMDFVLVYIMR